MAITRLGFGCARLFSGRELRSSARLLEVAYATGIRHFDTAPSYGGGTSESVLGQILSGRDDVTIATKVGLPHPRVVAPATPGQLYRRFVRPSLTYVPGVKRVLLRLASMSRHSSGAVEALAQKRILGRDEILSSLEESLKRLKRSTIDLYLIHEPDQFVLSQELFQVFEDLKAQDVIGAYGLGYDRNIKDSFWLGAVIQEQFDANHAASFRQESLIFHGLIRRPPTGVGDNKLEGTPGKRIRGVLQRYPECAVIFSASSAWQIRNIAKDVSNDIVDAQSDVRT